MNGLDIEMSSIRNFLKLSNRDQKILTNTINDFYINADKPFWAKDVVDHIKFKLNISYPLHFILRFMKNNCNLTYKKIKPRPTNINISKLRIVRLLYIVEFLKSLTLKTLIINIDESFINRHIKKNYSWSIKRWPNESLNSNFSGSTSIRMAIYSNGTWTAALTNESIDSNKFLIFIEHLEYWLKDSNFYEKFDILLIMDNCAIHKTNQVKERLLKTNIRVLYLPHILLNGLQ